MKPIQVTRWQAQDGTLFETVEGCLEYENQQTLASALKEDPIRVSASGYVGAYALSDWLKKHSSVVCKLLHAEE